MKQALIIAAGVSMLVASEVQAQAPCTPNQQATYVSRQAADVFEYMAPQLATAIAGGSPTLGQTSTLGGLGHFSVGLHGTALFGSSPDVSQFPTCSSGSTILPTSSQVVPGAGADAAIGVFGGLPLALTNVGAVDVLLSAMFVPAVDRNRVSIQTPEGGLRIGYGARIGLLSESILVPGVSLSYMRRDLPTVNIFASTPGLGLAPDSLFITQLRIKTTAWRIEASKSLLMFGVFGGVGRDRYKSSVDTVRASVGLPGIAGRTSAILTPAPSQTLDRTNYFIGAKANLLIFKLAAEVGQARGGEVTTFNTFSGSAPNATRTYASLGVRFGL